MIETDAADGTQDKSAAHTTASHAALEASPLLVGPATAADQFNRIQSFLLPKACWKLEDTNFEFDSSFVLPFFFDAEPLKKLLTKHKGAKLSIFGHADPVGRDDYNKTLSGRRAQAIFALLTRKVELWEDLYFNHDTNGKDEWGVRSVQIMLNLTGHVTGRSDGHVDEPTRSKLKEFQQEQGETPTGFDNRNQIPRATFRKLARAYMDVICTDDDTRQFRLSEDDFLARGEGKDGKGDFQGCGEFNPQLIFSQQEQARFARPENKKQRDGENQPNRRVMVLLFRARSRVDPQKWPCPTVKEGVAGCRKRFWSNGEARRTSGSERREFKKTQDTFACRFYDRLSDDSPCEKVVETFSIRLYEPGGEFIALAPFEITIDDREPVRGLADENGIVTLREVEAPANCLIVWGHQPRGGAEPLLVFSLNMFLNAEDASKEEEARKKLANLGFIDDDLAVNTQDFQREFGHLSDPALAPTGQLDDRTMEVLRDVYKQTADDLRKTKTA